MFFYGTHTGSVVSKVRLTGSTRLRAGTATKLVLNLVTTLAMTHSGKVLSNLMIDLNPSNAKLRDRAVRIVQEIASVSAKEADIFAGAPVAANVIRAMSLVPDAVRQLSAQMSAQYVNNPDLSDLTYTGDLTLTRPQIELVAARTSAINDCFY